MYKCYWFYYNNLLYINAYINLVRGLVLLKENNRRVILQIR
jgi:hypothetical protein